MVWSTVQRPIVYGVMCVIVGAVGAVSYIAFSAGIPFADPGCQKEYPFTSRSLDCAEYDQSLAKIAVLDSTFDQAATQYIKQGRATRISIWARDLETKRYASTNEHDLFDPASLLKLPLAIGYYKFSEIQPSVLNNPITYTKPAELDDRYNYFTATTSLIVGQSYTVNELIRLMLVRSDNGAYFTLLHHVDGTFYNQVMLDLGIQIPANGKILDFMTVKSYANVFRILYNASYLNRKNSEGVLQIMSESDFRGIRDAVPQSVAVADKFGERSVYDQNGTPLKKELHDCAIVYKGTHPYSLCIMTEGTNFNELIQIIRDLSLIVYQQI